MLVGRVQLLGRFRRGFVLLIMLEFIGIVFSIIENTTLCICLEYQLHN